jgi:hypothetical protein
MYAKYWPTKIRLSVLLLLNTCKISCVTTPDALYINEVIHNKPSCDAECKIRGSHLSSVRQHSKGDECSFQMQTLCPLNFHLWNLQGTTWRLELYNLAKMIFTYHQEHNKERNYDKCSNLHMVWGCFNCEMILFLDYIRRNVLVSNISCNFRQFSYILRNVAN